MAHNRQLEAVVAIAATVAAFLLAFTVYAVQQTPWFGVELGAPDTRYGLEVREIIGKGARDKLAIGDVLLAVHGNGRVIPLDPEAIEPVPFHFASRSVASYNQFLQMQTALDRALHNPAIVLIKRNGDTASVATARRSFTQLPFDLWYLASLAVIAIIFALTVLYRYRAETAAVHYFVGGVAFFVGVCSNTIFLLRPLALDGTFFHHLILLSHFATNAFCASLLALLWTYPIRLKPNWLPYAIYAFFGFFWLAELFQLVDSLIVTFYSPLFFAAAGAVVIGGCQWRMTRSLPADRAVLRWILVVLLSTASVVLFGAIAPRVVGHPGWLTVPFEAYIILLMYLSIAVALTRYRVVNLEWWWSNLGGCFSMLAIVSLLYVILKQVFAQSSFAAAVVALLIGGWSFFPSRNLLRTYWRSRPRYALETFMPDLLQDIFASPTLVRLSERWESFLQRLFNPLVFTIRREPTDDVLVAHDGLILRVPDIGHSSTLELSYSHRGTRLFAPEDVQITRIVLNLLRHAHALQEQQAKGIERERGRIARDLHDDVGARLLTLIHGAHDLDVSELGRTALQDLRLSIAGLDGASIALEDLLADQRLELKERADAAGSMLKWSQSDVLPSIQLSARERINLQRVIREAMSNALRHAQPTAIHVESDIIHGTLNIRLTDDGQTTDVTDWIRGRGTRNMHERMREIGGSVTWHASQPHGCCVEIVLPLQRSSI